MQTNPVQRSEVTTAVAARIVGVALQTIHTWRRRGKLTHYRRSGSAPHSPFLFDREEICRLKSLREIPHSEHLRD